MEGIKDMKKLLLAAVFLFAASLGFAEIMKIPFHPEAFDVSIQRIRSLVEISPKVDGEVDCQRAFMNERFGFELRYSLFKQDDTELKNPDDIKVAFALLSMILVTNASGREVSPDTMVSYKDSDVLADFNGTFGNNAFVRNPTSEFSSGYSFILMSSFYKYSQGVVFQSILFNNPELVNNAEFWKAFHTFRFKD